MTTQSPITQSPIAATLTERLAHVKKLMAANRTACIANQHDAYARAAYSILRSERLFLLHTRLFLNEAGIAHRITDQLTKIVTLMERHRTAYDANQRDQYARGALMMLRDQRLFLAFLAEQLETPTHD